MTDNSELLNLIDDRIRKLQQENIGAKLYTGVITASINDNWCKARISGFETEFTFANKSGEFLSQGDSVYIETINGNLNSGVVIRRFDTYTFDELASRETGYHIPQKCIFPIGFIIMLSISDYPSKFFGGTWEAIGAGRCLIGSGYYQEGSSVSDYILGNQGGEKNHTLSVGELPQNIGTLQAISWKTENDTGAFSRVQNYADRTASIGTDMGTTTHTLSGGGQAHNNMQPYLVVNIWKRIA